MKFDAENPRHRALSAALQQRLGVLLEQAAPEWAVHDIDVRVEELFNEDTQEVQLRIRLRPKVVDRYEAAKAAMDAQRFEAQWRADMRKFGTAPLEPLTPAPAPFVAPPQQYGVRELDL